MTRPNQQLQRRHNSDPIYQLAPEQEQMFQQNAKNVTDKQRMAVENNKRYDVKKSGEVSIYNNNNYIEQETIDEAFRQAMTGSNKTADYEAVKNVQSNGGKQQFPLKASRGTQYMLDGESVLQFDFGGTGATALQRGRLEKRYATHEDEANINSQLPMKDMKYTSRLGKFFRACFSWLPGVWSTRKRDEYVRNYNEAAAFNRQQAKEAYGESVTLIKNGKRKTFEYIRRKDEKNEETNAVKTRYTFAGPTLMNGGDYQLDNLEEYVLALGSQWLAPKLRRIAEKAGDGPVPADTKSLHVMLQGHSRGGVAASMAAMRLNKWLYDNFEEKIARLVKFDIIQYDPVPGKFSRTGIREVADLGTTEYYDKKGNVTTDVENAKYRSLGEQQNSTLVYCLRTFKNHFFTPQQILGAKRVILTVRDHNSIFSHEKTTTKKRAADKKAHRSPFINLEDKTAYRGSNINEMPEGLYFADEKNVLHKVNSIEEYRQMRDDLLRGEARRHQEKRQNILDSVAEAYFEQDLERQYLDHYSQNRLPD